MTALLRLALLVAAPSPEGGRLSRGEDNGDRGARVERVWSCAARSSWAARTGAVERRTQAEATRNERHRKSDKRQQRRGRKYKKDETGDDRLLLAEEREQRQWKYKIEIVVQAAAVMTARGAVIKQQWQWQCWQCRGGQGDWRLAEAEWRGF